jgi:hypothetical protein
MLRKLFVAFLAAILCFALVAQASSVVDQIYDEAGIMANETSPSPSPSSAPAANITASPSSAPVAPSVSPSSAPVANVTASPSPSSAPVANATASPSPKPKLACGNYTGCGNCTEQWNCVWCDSKCEDGGVWGPNQNPFNSCPDWRWRQCKANGKAIFWSAVCIAAVLVVLFLFCCFCCCCYCRRKRRLRHIISNQKSWSQIKAEEAEMDRLLGTRTPKTDTRREQVYAKYGRPGERSVNNNRSSLFAQ